MIQPSRGTERRAEVETSQDTSYEPSQTRPTAKQTLKRRTGLRKERRNFEQDI